MSNFFVGLGLGVLGFGVYQFSRLFGLYHAHDQKGRPWPYQGLSFLGYSLMGTGAVIVIAALL